MKPKYTVKESTHTHWDRGQWIYEPKFQLIMNRELVCQMESSTLMENIVRQRFNEMARRFNEQPFEIDLK